MELYCPGMNWFDSRDYTGLLQSGSRSISSFNLTAKDIYKRYRNLGAIHLFKKKMKSIVDRKENVYKDTIPLWNHSDKLECEEDFKEVRRKIKMADRKDMIELFSSSKLMMEALGEE